VNARGDIQFFLLGQKSKSNNGYRYFFSDPYRAMSFLNE
jgi:hypothetical protein